MIFSAHGRWRCCPSSSRRTSLASLQARPLAPMRLSFPILPQAILSLHASNILRWLFHSGDFSLIAFTGKGKDSATCDLFSKPYFQYSFASVVAADSVLQVSSVWGATCWATSSWNSAPGAICATCWAASLAARCWLLPESPSGNTFGEMHNYNLCKVNFLALIIFSFFSYDPSSTSFFSFSIDESWCHAWIH